MEHNSCDGCRHDLGGGRDNCRINLAYECRDGGGFEAWEAPEEATPDATGPMCEESKLYTCPWCGNPMEYVEEVGFEAVEEPEDEGILPTGRKNQIAWLIFYTITMLMLGAIAYKYALVLF